MEMEIAISGHCVLSSAGETALALCESSALGKKITQQVDLQAYEKETASQDTGPRELYRIQKLLLIAFLRALRVAGLKTGAISPERMGIFLGNSYGIEEFKTEFFRLYKKSTPNLTRPTLFPFTNANSLASWMAIQAGAMGPNLTFVSGGTSSTDAILAACDSLIANECDVAFVGGISIIDNNLSDEFYDSGFKYESAGMLVLEKMRSAVVTNRKPSAILNFCKRTLLTQEQMETIKHKKPLSRRNDEMHDCLKEVPEIIYLGNNLGDNVFNYSKDKPDTACDKSKFLFLSDLVGNVFDEAGVLGLSLSAELLNLHKDAKWNPFCSATESILYSNVDSYGTSIEMLVNKV